MSEIIERYEIIEQFYPAARRFIEAQTQRDKQLYAWAVDQLLDKWNESKPNRQEIAEEGLGNE